MMALLYKASWPQPLCPNPNSGPDHQFTFYPFGAMFVCDGCGAMIAGREAAALIDWWSYVGNFAGGTEATANKWN